MAQMIPTMTQSAEHSILVATHTRSRLYVLHNFFTLWRIFKTFAQILTIMRQCAYDMHGTTSRSWLVKVSKYTFMSITEGDLTVLQTALLACSISLWSLIKTVHSLIMVSKLFQSVEYFKSS
jgi:hypothetical protein